MEVVSIEMLLGQDQILQRITANPFRCYLIKGKVGLGKKYILNKLYENTKTIKNAVTFYLKHNIISEDYRPFLSAISQKESVLLKSGSKIIKNFASLIPVVGDILEKVLETEIKYPAEFSETEISIISQIRSISMGRPIIFLCEEINMWDDPSRILLQKIMSNLSKQIFSNSKISLICSSSDIDEPDTSYSDTFMLEPFDIEHATEIVHSLFPSTCLNDSSIRTICNACDCNIGIVKCVIEKMDTATPFSDSEIRSHIVSTIKNENVILLLDKASIIGCTTSKKILRAFMGFEEFEFTASLNDAVSEHFVETSTQNVAFIDRMVWNIFFIHNNSNKRFHYELAECLKLVIPTGYKRIGAEYLLAGLEEKAALYYTLASIYYYVTYKIEPSPSDYELGLIKSYGYFDCYSQIIQIYKSFFSESIDIVHIFPTANVAELQFEVDYAKALIYSNSDIDYTYYQNVYNDIRKWVINTDFQKNSPEQWLRAATIYLEIGVELHKGLDSNILSEVQGTISKYESTDVNIEIFDSDFKAKSNSIYSIEIAADLTFQAVDYMKGKFSSEGLSYKYLIALNNALANSVVIGDSQRAFEYCSDAIMYLQENKFNSEYFTCVIVNNILLTLLTWEQDVFTSYFNSIEQVMKKFISSSRANTPKTLLKNNLAVFYLYYGKIDKARDIFNDLYLDVKYNSQIDDYYSYYIKNNYYLVEYMLTGILDSKSFIDELSSLAPLDPCMKYFNARNQYMKEKLDQGFRIHLSNDTWNEFEEIRIGNAWKFWGRWFLLTDIQFWSE